MCQSFRTSNDDNAIEWARVNNDVNGNPRYVCHYLNLLTQAEKDNNDWQVRKYDLALARASRIGGRKFHNKQYGGGIVFQSYNLQETESAIARAIEYDTIPNECYFIVDDVLSGESGKEGFIVSYGNPETAIGATLAEFKLLREAKAYIAKHVTADDKVYRVKLARRHGAHIVERINVNK